MARSIAGQMRIDYGPTSVITNRAAWKLPAIEVPGAPPIPPPAAIPGLRGAPALPRPPQRPIIEAWISTR
jgi:hypothetical protein